jgi:biotin carboxylase
MLPNEANFFRNKLVMKKSLSAAGLRTPWFAECTDRAAVENLLARYGAVVVKPVDGYGSRGVEFIRSPEQLAAWYARCKAPAAFEAEELIEGVLYHVNAVVRSGLPALTASAIYLPGMGNIDFSAGAPFVSAIVVEDGLRCRLEEFSDKVIATLGLRDGVTHLECFVTTEGEIVFCEIAARPGGGGIVWMIEAQYGVNYNRVVLLLEAGRSDLIAIPNESGAGVAGLIGFRSAQSAFVERAAKPDDFRDDWIRLSQIDVSEGAFKAASAHCTDFLGLLIFNSRDMDEFEQNRLHLSKRFYDALELRAI